MTEYYFKFPGTKHKVIIEAEDQEKANKIFEELFKQKNN